MHRAKKTVRQREAFTLIELIVVIAIILAIAALAAAFAPRVSDSTNLTRAIDQTSQWLLTAKMRAKRDQLATGVRFIPDSDPTNVGKFFQLQYIQQPDSLSGSPGGGTIQSAGSGVVTFVPGSVDFALGGAVVAQGLVQAGDYLEVRDSGVYCIGAVTGANQLTLGLGGTPTAYDMSLSINNPPSTPPTTTTNYRILRQPRILIGEDPLNLPNNFAVDMVNLPGASVPAGSNGYVEILFSPTGAVVGTNAGSGKVYLYVHDITQTDPNMTGIIAVQCRTGFIGAYSVNTTIPSGSPPTIDPFLFAESGRESGL